MRKIVKKIIFPTYNKKKHNFLYQKWYFRALIIVYILFTIILFIKIVDSEVMDVEICDSWYDMEELPFSMRSEGSLLCYQRRLAMLPGDIASSAIETLFIYYLIQLVFFKIIIDFIIIKPNKN